MLHDGELHLILDINEVTEGEFGTKQIGKPKVKPVEQLSDVNS